MQPIEIDQLVNGQPQSGSMPAVGTVPGPDVIIGELVDLVQLGNGAFNNQVGISLGTDACNKGTIDVDWLALPNNDHPFIPQNLYRMSGGATNNERFEQLGQSWGKHAFTAASSNTCNFGCNGVGGPHLGSGCSDFYSAGLNGGQTGIGSRAWVNPFTGSFVGATANDHSGHSHNATSHRILIDTSDLIPAQNQGATYFAEAEYIVPHEGTWCQAHPDQCNMYNNASYRRYTVSGGPTNFNFVGAGSTVREQPAIEAWVGTGATVNQILPAPGAPRVATAFSSSVTKPPTWVAACGTMSTRCITRTSIGRFNLSLCLSDLESTSVTLNFTRRLSILVSPTMGLWVTPGTAAHHGMLSKTRPLSHGTRKRLRLIKTRTRFATARFTISVSTPIKGQMIRMQR